MIIQVHFSVHTGPRSLAEWFINKTGSFSLSKGVAKAGTILSESVHLHTSLLSASDVALYLMQDAISYHCESLPALDTHS